MSTLQGIPEVQRLVAERLYITASQCVPQHELLIRRAGITEIIDQSMRELVYQLDTYVHGMVKERIVVHRKWPKTWWDAFKARWFPHWAKRRWPVEWERVDIDERIFLAICPHIQDDPQRTHLQWMASKMEPVV